MAERHAETRRDRNYKVSKISNFHDMSKKRSGLIHTIRSLNIAEAICLRQKGRRDVTRIPLLTWLDSLGNASCPHGLKHAKLSPVSNSSPPPPCPLIDSRSAGAVHCQNGELDSGTLAVWGDDES